MSKKFFFPDARFSMFIECFAMRTKFLYNNFHFSLLRGRRCVRRKLKNRYKIVQIFFSFSPQFMIFLLLFRLIFLNFFFFFSMVQQFIAYCLYYRKNVSHLRVPELEGIEGTRYLVRFFPIQQAFHHQYSIIIIHIL